LVQVVLVLEQLKVTELAEATQLLAQSLQQVEVVEQAPYPHIALQD
jgi:hypothetical protein